jgi:hypothetical protein
MALSYLRNTKRDTLLPYVGHMDQLAGIKMVEAIDGKARGSRMFNVYTGSGLDFTVTADRALDISACHYKGMSLAWASSVGDVAPAFFEPEGVGWLRSFPGGMLATCGLNHYGPPCEDQGESFGLHGRIGNEPARYVNQFAGWVDEDYILGIFGEVRQTRSFGENIVMRRRISTALGSNKVHLEDEITNEGFAPQPHLILYHFNAGFPLLQPSTQLRVDAEKTQPRDAEAEKGANEWNQFHAPVAGYQEQVFIHTPRADDEGKVKVEVFNPDLGIGLRWTWDKKMLPYLVQWKMMGAGMYVLGIEPTNCAEVRGHAAARETGELPHLEPGEAVRYVIDLEVFEAI